MTTLHHTAFLPGSCRPEPSYTTSSSHVLGHKDGPSWLEVWVYVQAKCGWWRCTRPARVPLVPV